MQVQGHVKQSKVRFDKYKLDCLQKVDLLAASRFVSAGPISKKKEL